MRLHQPVLTLLLLVGITPPSFGDSSPTPAQITGDNGTVKSGDLIIWKVEKPITLQKAKSAPAADSSASKTVDDGQVCFPVESVFEVTNVTAAAKTGTDSPAGTTVASNTQLVSGHFPSEDLKYHLHFWHRNSLGKGVAGTTPGANSACSQNTRYAVKDATYDFTADQLSKQDFYRSGFTWGALVIPYKFYMNDHSFKSNTSTVAFAGYEGWFPGLSLSVVAALGPGLTTTSTTTPAPAAGTGGTATTTKSSTFVTYTVAAGLIAAFGDSKTVKAGLLFGRDYQGKGSDFQYENKNWLALCIGAGF